MCSTILNRKYYPRIRKVLPTMFISWIEYWIINQQAKSVFFCYFKQNFSAVVDIYLLYLWHFGQFLFVLLTFEYLHNHFTQILWYYIHATFRMSLSIQLFAEMCSRYRPCSSHGQGQINIKIQMLFLPGCSYLIIFYK